MLRAGRRYPLDAPVLRSCSHPQTRAETNQSGRQTLGGRRKQDKSGTAGGATQSTCPARHDFDNVQRPVHCTIQDQPDARGRHVTEITAGVAGLLQPSVYSWFVLKRRFNGSAPSV